MEYLFINSIMENPSLCDGYGYRTVLYLQGCNLRCKGCHNKMTWDIKKGKKIDINTLANSLRKKCVNKKLTISGGEPLLQIDGLLELFKALDDFDICLYTGYDFNDVPKEILKYLKYIKYGPFIEERKTFIKPFVGSDNQVFMEVKHNENAK